MNADAEHIANMTQSDGWLLVYPKLQAFIIDLQNINNIDMEKPETISVQLMARKMAAELIYTWLKREVFGTLEQAATQKATETPDDHILRA